MVIRCTIVGYNFISRVGTTATDRRAFVYYESFLIQQRYRLSKLLQHQRPHCSVGGPSLTALMWSTLHATRYSRRHQA